MPLQQTTAKRNYHGHNQERLLLPRTTSIDVLYAAVLREEWRQAAQTWASKRFRCPDRVSRIPSGCHWTPTIQRSEKSRDSSASITPSAERAATVRTSARPLIP